MKIFLVSAIFFIVFLEYAFAHPEFQRYSKSTSGRSVNCAMCHTHSDGPEGLKPGQIGCLNENELNALGLARQAFKPGTGVKSPLLNEFGNLILNELGKEKIMVFKQKPELLAGSLSKTSDLDADGILDTDEFRDGTHPLNALDGHPWKLFKNNIIKNWFDIFMMILATGFGLFGLYNAILWLSSKAERKD